MGESEERYSVAEIREAYRLHGWEDSWGLQAFYEHGLIAALRGEFDGAGEG